MQGFLKGEVAVHRSPRRGQRCGPRFPREVLQRPSLHGPQAPGITVQNTPARGHQERLLIDRLIGAALLQSARAIRTQHQQRNRTKISLNNSRQQVGHRRSRGGHQGGRDAVASAQAQGKERSRSLIHAAVQVLSPLGQ